MRVLAALRPAHLDEQRPDEVVDDGDVSRRRREAGADRPYRLIGDHHGLARAPGRERPSELPNDDSGLLARLALGMGLADANDRNETGLQRRFGLGVDKLVGLFVDRAALGVADDDVSRARVLEHGGRNVAGERPARLRAAILGAERELAAFDLPGRLSEQRERREDSELGLARFAGVGRAAHRVDLVERRGKAVHLPVAGDERTHARGHREPPAPWLARLLSSAPSLCKASPRR